ncbi:hypothetical protein LCGC14_1349800 [marine sediment metagenome]|uniref:Uncharacterized protein n=1 Tax=marine sediment metagenome TaxID=412755 RepID=A0A0F9NDH8_9ZZZZ
MGYSQTAIPKHFNGTANTTPADVDFSNVSGSILIHNTGVTEDLLVSLDGGANFKTIPSENVLGYDDINLKKVVVKTSTGTTTYEIIITVDE